MNLKSNTEILWKKKMVARMSHYESYASLKQKKVSSYLKDKLKLIYLIKRSPTVLYFLILLDSLFALSDSIQRIKYKDGM